MIVIDAATVHRLLSTADAIPLMRTAFLLGDDPAHNPPRTVLAPAGASGLLGMMPAWLPQAGVFGIKAIAVFPGRQPSHRGAVLLFDTGSGALNAIVDAGAITAVRTAAATAVATDLLARSDCISLGLIGTGEQALAHARAISLVRPIRRICLTGRNAQHAAAAAAAIAAETSLPTHAVALQEAIGCDIVTTLTAATEPLFAADSIVPGQHLNLVGASAPDQCEAPPELLPRIRYFGDARANITSIAGEYRRAIANGYGDCLTGSIADVMTGKVEGRRHAADITAFRSLGLAAQDLVAAQFIAEAASKAGLGTTSAFT
jgi:ornithine cyclodeaminase/alanine dehydrogenase-like protein (mu-crystallin family)